VQGLFYACRPPQATRPNRGIFSPRHGPGTVKIAFFVPILFILLLAAWRMSVTGNLRKSACMRMK
jgi:hypothetical protein